MKKKSILGIVTIVFAAIFVVYIIFLLIFNSNLEAKGLALRNAPYDKLYRIGVILFHPVVILVTVLVALRAYKKNSNTWHRIIDAVIAAAVFLFVSGYIGVSVMLAYNPWDFPEHEVVKDNKKYLAVVNSFLSVDVDYYDYVDENLRGNKIRISENYGKGGYDPFETSPMPAPKETNYNN